MKTVRTTFLALFALGTSSVALADEPAAADPAPAVAPTQAVPLLALAERQQSVNLSPLGVAFGSYALNYEYLAKDGHGLLAEASFGTGKDSAGNTTSDFGAGVGYRYHFAGGQSSWFAGPLLSYSAGNGTGTVSVNNGPTKAFDVNYSSVAVTANIGRRWVFADLINVTFRIGGGKAFRTFSTTSSDPDAQLAVDLVQKIVDFLPIAFDGELSVGVNF
jgi:hypothetical protein